MAVSPLTIRDLLNNKRWSACADNAAMALAEGEKTKEERAFLYFARSKSLSKLRKYTSAVEPGRIALYLAEEGTDYDFAGEALLNLAWIQHRISGMEHSAVETQHRFFELFPRYKTIRDQYLTAQFNLGVYLRAAGRYEEALAQFDNTFREAKKRGDNRIADLSRNSAVWEALRLERVALAESLIRAGEPYTTADPVMQASHLIDLAQVAFLKRNYTVACGHAFHAVTLCGASNELCAQALEILNRVCDRIGDPHLALTVGLFAKRKAELDDRHDIVAQVQASLRNLALRHPEVLNSIVGILDSSPNQSIRGLSL